MPFHIIRDDLSKVSVDAIVNSANREPICGGGCEFHLYNAAGYNELLKAREKIGPLNVAEIGVTDAFNLKAKYIIHTVGPIWNDGISGELIALKNCYKNTLEKAKELKCKSIAFPLISSGSFHFPKEKALKIAKEVICDFIKTNEMTVKLVIFDEESFNISKKLNNNITAFIKEEQTKECDLRLYNDLTKERGYNLSFESFCKRNSRDHRIKSQLNFPTTSQTFQERLFHIIQQKKLDEVEIYKNANLDRKLFSKIKKNKDYQPKKNTALAFAISLKLELSETEDLLARAGFAFSPANNSDHIVKYFIIQQKYDIWEINNVLFKHGFKPLGQDI